MEHVIPPRRIHTDDNGVTVTDTCLDARGQRKPGNRYLVSGLNAATPKFMEVVFQSGHHSTDGLNGLTNEMLLYILKDRIQYLDACVPAPENKDAMRHIDQAIVALEQRMKRRLEEGKAGTDRP